MKTLGKNTVEVLFKEKFHAVEFQIIEHNGAVPVPGLNTCLEMELIKRVYTCTINTEQNDYDESKGKNCTQAAQADKIVQEFDDVFKGLGCFDWHYHIKIDESVTPVIHPPCKVPFALKD